MLQLMACRLLLIYLIILYVSSVFWVGLKARCFTAVISFASESPFLDEAGHASQPHDVEELRYLASNCITCRGRCRVLLQVFQVATQCSFSETRTGESLPIDIRSL